MNFLVVLERAQRILERQSRTPQYHEREAAVRSRLAERHVSPEIIDRVIRLNPRLEEGMRLRGIHYTTMRDDEPTCFMGLVRKGNFLRKYGGDAWRALPRDAITKRGRREYVTIHALMERGLS